MKAKTQKVDSTRHASAMLEPLIRMCREKYGLQADVVRRLNARMAAPVAPVNVSRWLHEDPAMRVEPLMGMGLLLLEVAREIASERPDVDAGRSYLLRHSRSNQWFVEGRLTTAEYRTSPLLAEATSVTGRVLLQYGARDGMVGKWHVVEKGDR